MDRPLLAITMGDPAGVGPEAIAAAWTTSELHANCRAVVIGHPEVLRRAVSLVGGNGTVVEVSSPDELLSDHSTIPCLTAGLDEAASVRPATVDPRGGRAAYDAVALAAELALSGRVDAVTTAPLNKAALAAAGHPEPGHTELLATLCGIEEAGMMLYLAPGSAVRGRIGLGVVHVTLHCPLRRIFEELTPARIVTRAQWADEAVRLFLGDSAERRPPQIGVCALNPHAGEAGLFGDEERRLIRPAVRRGRALGLSLEGPLPADTLIARAVQGEFDAIVAMYHDQGHIPLKLLGMFQAVNITLGLPIVRTSVAHGTAFDLAWQGRAETSGMIEAVRVAAQLARRRESSPLKRNVVTN